MRTFYDCPDCEERIYEEDDASWHDRESCTVTISKRAFQTLQTQVTELEGEKKALEEWKTDVEKHGFVNVYCVKRDREIEQLTTEAAKYRNQMTWAVTHYKIVDTDGIFEVLRQTLGTKAGN